MKKLKNLKVSSIKGCMCHELYLTSEPLWDLKQYTGFIRCNFFIICKTYISTKYNIREQKQVGEFSLVVYCVIFVFLVMILILFLSDDSKQVGFNFKVSCFVHLVSKILISCIDG